MIIGIYNPGDRSADLAAVLSQSISLTRALPCATQAKLWHDAHVALAWIPEGIGSLDEPGQPFQNADQTITLVFEGKIYNLDEIAATLGNSATYKTDESGRAIVALYEKFGEDALEHLNGKFAFALWDATRQLLFVARDRLGIEPVFVHQHGDCVRFASTLRAFINTGFIDTRLCGDAVLQYLLFCYNPGEQTLIDGVRYLRAGHKLNADSSGADISRYWRLSYADQPRKTFEQYQDEFLELYEDAVRIRIDPRSPPAVFLSGGTDSSGVVAITSKMVDPPLQTIGFRCIGPNYDESPFAKFVADHFGATYHRVDYDPEQLALIEQAVDWMDEPFGNLGIEIGTFLMGAAAGDRVSYVFSGEGGDELFAGHPVYVADKVAALVDILPSFLVRPIARQLQKIPDSDEKLDLKVKLKRFAYSVAFPRELLSHRWRIYYTREEIETMCSAEFVGSCNLGRMYDAMLESTDGMDGPDQLSRALYSDHFTLVAFYLRRLRLIRAHGVESRLPLLDHRLVEYAAQVPSKLKIRKMSDTKHIYKKILERLLSDKILYERPKLGHGVPMKNWFREDAGFSAWIRKRLMRGQLSKRRLFDDSVIETMLDEHMSKKANHSHRLWALLVLDLWLEKNLPVET